MNSHTPCTCAVVSSSVRKNWEKKLLIHTEIWCVQLRSRINKNTHSLRSRSHLIAA